MSSIVVNTEVESNQFVLALRADLDENATASDEATKIRLIAPLINEQLKGDAYTLPYVADWRYNSEVMNEDTLINFEVAPNAGKYTADQTYYKLGGWTLASPLGGRPFFLAKSGSKALINTFEFVDNNQKEPVESWLISPKIEWNNADDMYISFKAGKSAADQLSSNLNRLFSTDYEGDVNSATWMEIATDIIPKDLVGMTSEDMLHFEQQFSTEATNGYFAIKGARAGRDFAITLGPIDTGSEAQLATSTQSIIAPNRTTDQLVILATDAVKTVRIVSMTGQMVMSKTGNYKQLSVRHLERGIYLVEIHFKNDRLVRETLIKE